LLLQSLPALLFIFELRVGPHPFSKLFKMKELVRDTVVGHLLRSVTRGKVLRFEEERDPSLWKRYVDKEKSGRMAHHGDVEEEKKEEQEGNDTSNENMHEQQRAGVAEGDTTANTRNSSDTRVGSGEARRNEVSGVPVDPEKGRDVSIVSWFGDNDPEVCTYSELCTGLLLTYRRIP
jgi:DHA1 family multidrug resistance protein-like MFS transporter